MAVRLWLASDVTALILSMDDPAVDLEFGLFQFPVRLVTGKFGVANSYCHIRNFVQQLFIADSVTATVTPVVNGTENVMDGIAFSADAASDGNSVQMQIPMAAGGIDFQVAIDITAHQGKTELGGAEMWLAPRRQKPG